MPNSDWLIVLTDYIALVSTAITGTIVAIDRRLDMIGVWFLALISSFGGGVLRDVLLGETPPRFFTHYHWLLLVTAVSLAIFLTARFGAAGGDRVFAPVRIRSTTFWTPWGLPPSPCPVFSLLARRDTQAIPSCAFSWVPSQPSAVVSCVTFRSCKRQACCEKECMPWPPSRAVLCTGRSCTRGLLMSCPGSYPCY